MKWRIKNPAPLDSRLKKWGDYHFGRSLAKYLRRLGEDVESDYQPAWATDQVADVVVVLRGKFPHDPSDRDPGAFHVLWNMSHPESVTVDEYRSYDLVLAASGLLATRLAGEIDVPIHPFLQCTDTEEFFPREPPQGRHDMVFVGNTREQRRDGIIWATEEGFPVKIWGRGWGRFVPTDHVMGDYVPNEALGELYSASRLTLNDHWPDMRRYGFINNRVFDALACGLPVISDHHDALEELFPDEILYYSTREELVACVERCMLSWSSVESRTRTAQERIAREFSFAERASRLLELVSDRLGRPRMQRTHRMPWSAPGTATFLPPPREDLCWCPVCERYCPRFEPFGIRKRPGARCPHCGALERHRSAWLFLRTGTDLCDGRQKRLLHCSPEHHIRDVFAGIQGLRSFGCDLIPGPGVAVTLDLTEMPLSEASLDCIYCSHVLEHIENDAPAMRQFYHALKPGGWALIMTPIQGDHTYEDSTIRTPEDRLRHFGQSDHVRIYGRDLADRLREAGFEVSEHLGDLGLSEERQRFMGLKQTYLYFCRRPAGDLAEGRSALRIERRLENLLARAVPPPRWPRSSCTRLELQLLTYLAEHEYTGEGEILDVGCGNGGSTYCLCQGLERNPSPAAAGRSVHAIDWFDRETGGHVVSAMEKFARTVAGCEHRIAVHDGDFHDFEWDAAERPIELLFVDIAKELSLFQTVVRLFYPALVAGKALLIHQDFGRPRLPWLHYGTMLTLPWMTLLDVVDDSLVLRVNQIPPGEILHALATDSLAVERKADLLVEARDRFRGIKSQGVDYSDLLALSEAYVWLYAGRHREALRRLSSLEPTAVFEERFGEMIDHLLRHGRRGLTD